MHVQVAIATPLTGSHNEPRGSSVAERSLHQHLTLAVAND